MNMIPTASTMGAKSFDPTYPLYPILSGLGFILCLIPLPWHLQAWNSGTCAFMVWTAATCFVYFVNSIVWAGNVSNVAPAWCDISTQIALGASIGIPSSILCISRRLYSITAGQTATITREDKRRGVIIDLAIALGLPAAVLIMHIPVHPHRFDILEGVGCYQVTYNTLPAYFLYFMWPPLIGCVSFVYSCLTLRNFWRRRVQFNQLISKNSALNPSRFFRLMLLAILDICCTIPLGVYVIYMGNKDVNLFPWISWEETHFDWLRVDLIPATLWRKVPARAISIEMTRYLPVVCALTFFVLFGFAEEAMKHYRSAFWWCAGKFGFKPTPVSLKSKHNILPSWVKPPPSPGTGASDKYPLTPVSPSSSAGYKASPPPRYSSASSLFSTTTPDEGDFKPLPSRPSTPAPHAIPTASSPSSSIYFTPSSPYNNRPYSYPFPTSPNPDAPPVAPAPIFPGLLSRLTPSSTTAAFPLSIAQPRTCSGCASKNQEMAALEGLSSGTEHERHQSISSVAL